MGLLTVAAEKLLEISVKMRDSSKEVPPAVAAISAHLLARELECEVRALHPEMWDDYVKLRDTFVRCGEEATERVVRRRQS